MMDEQARLKLQTDAKSKPELKGRGDPPDAEIWNQQMQMVRLFNQLIANIDRNLGNLIITKDWRLWPIDHTRAFRTYRDLKTPANVTRVERKVLERMKALDRDALKRETGKYLTTFQIDAVLARRDAIVARIEGLGPAAVFDRTGWYVPHPRRCAARHRDPSARNRAEVGNPRLQRAPRVAEKNQR